MINWIYILDFSLAGGLLVMMTIGIAFSAIMPALDRWNRRYFIILFSYGFQKIQFFRLFLSIY